MGVLLNMSGSGSQLARSHRCAVLRPLHNPRRICAVQRRRARALWGEGRRCLRKVASTCTGERHLHPEAFSPQSILDRSRAMGRSMDHTITAMERAFQLAKSGSYASVPDIKRRLNAEGFGVAQITGRVLFKQLNALIQAAQARNDGQGTQSPPALRQRDR
jgi:hypothetical protein